MNGKFFKNGKEIKPTFGDMEQIRALKEAERKVREEYEAKQREFEAKQKAEVEEQRIKAEKERKIAEEKAKKEKVSDFFKKHTYVIETSLFEACSNENEYQTMLKAYKIIVETIITETK